jgi:hypothetical protein
VFLVLFFVERFTRRPGRAGATYFCVVFGPFESGGMAFFQWAEHFEALVILRVDLSTACRMVNGY